MFRKIFLSCMFFMIACNAADKRQQAYEITQEFGLSQEENGMNGKIELLMDVRLTPSVREQLWDKGDWSFVLSSESELFKDFSTFPPRNAKLIIRDETGKVVAERALERPLASLEECGPNRGGKGGYLLTVDFSIGSGSYNGPGTTLLQVLNRTFLYAEAINVATRKRKVIRLTKSLKSDWRIETRSERTEILSLSSHPANNDNFVSDYVRYSFDGTQWLEYRQQKAGLWESDQPFPPRSAFP